MPRGESRASTTNVLNDLVEALAVLDQEMNDHLDSVDSLYVDDMIEVSMLGPEAYLNGGIKSSAVELCDLYEYETIEAVSVAESLTHVRERASIISGNLGETAKKSISDWFRLLGRLS